MDTDIPIPESPVVHDSFTSPEVRQESTFQPYSNLRLTAHQPRVLADPTSESIFAALEHAAPNNGAGPSDSDSRAGLILRSGLQWAVEYGDTELLKWLTELQGRWRDILNSEVADLQDDDGWGITGMAIQASCGRSEMESLVRAVVGRWGVEAGPREGRDHTGWTPLHLASLISTPPLVSYLLTGGASPHATTNRGLTPLDLVTGLPEKQQVAFLLEQAEMQMEAPQEKCSISEGRRRLIKQRRDRSSRHTTNFDDSDKRGKQRQEQEQWVRERVKVVGVDADQLLVSRGKSRPRLSEDSGIFMPADDSEDETVEVDDIDLVFSPGTLPGIFDTIITRYKPICHPISKRGLPANSIHLYARYAIRHDYDEWLGALMDGAVEAIEQCIYAHVDELPYLAFWSYNATLLLHLLLEDTELSGVCEELGLFGMLEELVNAIHGMSSSDTGLTAVFVIRFTERHVDVILDAAILEHETLDEMADVRFEDEWSLFRTLAPKRRSVIPRAKEVFDSSERPGSGIFDSVSGMSPFRSVRVKSSRQATAVEESGTWTPHDICDILTGVLIVLQLYEVNPALTVQAFSQVFFWISSELFNRILTRKKNLCRSKAVQIRMNITALEDWVRLNGIPTRCAALHLEPVMQLLQWLQCLSSINSFDDLIGTLQGMKALNPLQMRKAIRDYRYEVNEGRIDDESEMYLGHLQRDWEKRRIEAGIEVLKAQQAHKAQRKAQGKDDAGDPAAPPGKPGTPIDALFDGTATLADFEPAGGPDCFGELLDSRFMLAFQLPDDPLYIVATPPADGIYASIFGIGPVNEDTGRPGSRASFSSARPFGWCQPVPAKIRELPDDYFGWLREVDTERRRHMRQVVALDPPKPNKLAKPIPVTPARNVKREDITPTNTFKGDHTASPLDSVWSSASIDRFREQASTAFQSLPPQHHRAESFELKYVASPGGSLNGSASPFQTPPQPNHADAAAHLGQSPGDRTSGRMSSRGSWWGKLARKASLTDLRNGVLGGGEEVSMGEFGPQGQGVDEDVTLKAKPARGSMLGGMFSP